MGRRRGNLRDRLHCLSTSHREKANVEDVPIEPTVLIVEDKEGMRAEPQEVLSLHGWPDHRRHPAAGRDGACDPADPI